MEHGYKEVYGCRKERRMWGETSAETTLFLFMRLGRADHVRISWAIGQEGKVLWLSLKLLM